MNRWRDWWDQGARDLKHGEHALEDGDHEWAAFAAQQAAEKSLKALIMAHGGEPWGHSVTALLEALPPGLTANPEIIRGEAEGALRNATEVVEFCRSHIPR